MPTLTLTISKPLHALLEAEAKQRGIPVSTLVEQVIEGGARPSLYDRMSDLIGVGTEGPPDLATNKKHLGTLGLDRSARRK